jgi:NTP pyrophosphatase (non-canonical NTP hydrolase)
MNEIEDLTKKIRDFAKLRNWERFHTPKNLAMAVTGEAGELAAEFQWLTTEESENITKLPIENIELEIADVGIYLLRLCDVLKIDFAQVIKKKIAINQERFPEAR